MPTIELPEFGSAQSNENEPTTALKQSGWADGDEPPASVINWLHRTTYDSLRAMLGLHIVAGVYRPDVGPVVNPGSNYDIEAIGIDAGGYVLVVSVDLVSNGLSIYRSIDNGSSYSSVYSDGGWSIALNGCIAISDGVYAIITDDTGFFHVADYPYSSWSVQGGAWGTNEIVDYVLADIGDGHGPSLLLLSDHGHIYVTDATTAPSGSGDFTDYDISSVMDTPTSFALDRDNGILVVAGSDSGGGGGLTAWCDIADGVAAGDFSTPVDHGSSRVSTVAHNGQRFVIVVQVTEDMLYSDDGQNWTDIVNDTAQISSNNQILVADPITGFFLMFDGETSSASCGISASRDGIFWTRVTSGEDILVDGKRGKAPKLHPILHRLIMPSYSAGGAIRRYLVQTL